MNGGPRGSYGGVNCDTGSTCVKQIGDDAQVTWQVQVSPLAIPDDHGLMSGYVSHHAQIMIPSTVKDVSIKLTHMPVSDDGLNLSSDDPDSIWPDKEVDYQVPIVDSIDDVTDSGTYAVSSFVKNPIKPDEKDDLSLEYDDPDAIPEGAPAPKDTRVDMSEVYYQYGVKKSALPEQPNWDFYQVKLNQSGIFTFEVTGTVESVSEDTYVPIRAENMINRCSPVNDDYELKDRKENCTSLKMNDTWSWALTDELPPVMTKEQSDDVRKKIAAVYEDQGTVHGLTGVGTCAVTRNTSRFDTISTDIEAAAEGKYGAYARTFNLKLNPGMSYFGSLRGREDNCDQGFQHITLCPDEETEVPPSEEPVESEEPTPSDEPQESEEPTPSEEEEVEPTKPSKETEEPTDSEAPTFSDEPVESEAPTPSEETQESTPSDEPEQVKPVKPGERPEEREEPKVPMVPPTLPDAEVITTVVEPEDKSVEITGKPVQSEQDKPAEPKAKTESKIDSKPESKTVISESVKDNVAKQAKSTAKKDRPKVTTGGHLRVA
ncbi:hypothetical protein EML15_09190 [Corynebacterium sp. sy017]|uniref:hypothetical protein n=1 Tax=unclassified Corynebacterium TaxID=2624378 RepID=UPI0011846C11|nr:MULTISPECIES: hypothetical protein [unclassified Corynebacterium]MBP3089313.1 hypothetical protein [Corynebacterium sp. sy017]TSD90987.1 hypothetical protein ELY17_09410 [Corynebacterium sp. SY003]